MFLIETARLALRRMTTDDAAFIVRLLNQPSFLRFIGDKGVRTEEDARRYIEEGPLASYGRHGFGLFLVELREARTPIGICGLLKRDTLEDVDLGLAFLPEFEGKGFGFEAAEATLGYGYGTLGLEKIVAIVSKDNAASIHLLEKLGLRFEKALPPTPEGTEILLYVPGCLPPQSMRS
jgi:RimJ/RimL family protein N-acetyltransferase